MILKLTHPTSLRQRHIYIPVKPGIEIHTERLIGLTMAEIDKHYETLEKLDFTPRQYVHWSMMEGDMLIAVQPQLLELTINEGTKPPVLLTNWHALLLNDDGKRIDRLFRYEVPVPEGVTPGAGVNHIG